MNKTAKIETKKAEENLLGENTVLTLTIPWKTIDTEYQEALRHESQKVTLKGFRQGKAPLKLAEAAIGKQKIIDHALNHVIPHVYQEALEAAKVTPLTRPEITPKTTIEGEDWVFEAATAIAPKVNLGDYKKLIKEGRAKYQKKLAENKDAKENEDEMLQTIFVALIEGIKPKIAPLLLQEEMNQQLNQLYQQLKTRNIELNDYIKSQGKTEEEFKQDLAALSLGALQLEFVLQDITNDLKLEVNEEDINAWIKSQNYPENTKLPEDLKLRLSMNLLRRKTTQEITKIARD